MTDIIDLNERRKERDAGIVRLWECKDCNGSEFLLTVEGDVICMTCQEYMEDLYVEKRLDV